MRSLRVRSLRVRSLRVRSLIDRLPPRWRKLVRDVSRERGRTLTMVAAIAVSLIAIGAVLGAYAILTREMAKNYLGTRPASATLEMGQAVGPDLLGKVRAHPLVAEAEAREVIVARTQVGDEWRRTLVFVVDDFANLRLNRFRSEAGAWPPADGEVLLERSAIKMLGAGLGDAIVVKPPHGGAVKLRVSGLVHDPGLAPPGRSVRATSTSPAPPQLAWANPQACASSASSCADSRAIPARSSSRASSWPLGSPKTAIPCTKSAFRRQRSTHTRSR